MKILLSVFFIFIAGCSTKLPGAKQIITEQGHFTYYSSGTNKPTVVFESGLGDDMTSWQPIIHEVEDFVEVFAYNRAGFSGSDSKNSTRNGEIIVNELRDLLNSANLKPPYVLVGHSLGGAYMELYARSYPEEIAGVVLVDPNSSKYPARCKFEKLDYCAPPSRMPQWATLLVPSSVEGEIKGWSSTHEQVNAIDSFPNVPFALLSATYKNEKRTEKKKREHELSIELDQELLVLSTTSKFIPCDTCGHYIHKDEPSLVVNAIKWVLDKADNN